MLDPQILQSGNVFRNNSAPLSCLSVGSIRNTFLCSLKHHCSPTSLLNSHSCAVRAATTPECVAKLQVPAGWGNLSAVTFSYMYMYVVDCRVNVLLISPPADLYRVCGTMIHKSATMKGPQEPFSLHLTSGHLWCPRFIQADSKAKQNTFQRIKKMSCTCKDANRLTLSILWLLRIPFTHKKISGGRYQQCRAHATLAGS